MDWNSVLSIESDVNCAYDIFISTLLNIFNSNFPLTRMSRKSFKNKNWITAGLKKSINTKHKLYQKWINSKDKSDEIYYKSFAKSLKKLIALAEKDYYSNVLDIKFNSIKMIWSILNNTLNLTQK